jgi:hypothetical protein
MFANRRSFLKGSAALGVFASTEAAVAANSDAWIGFIHSASLRPEWERSFCGGLRNKGWEGDPTQAPTGSDKRVNVARHDMGGRYNAGNYTNISNAVTDLVGLPPNGNPVKSMVSAGGIISGSYRLSYGQLHAPRGGGGFAEYKQHNRKLF